LISYYSENVANTVQQYPTQQDPTEQYLYNSIYSAVSMRPVFTPGTPFTVQQYVTEQ